MSSKTPYIINQTYTVYTLTNLFTVDNIMLLINPLLRSLKYCMHTLVIILGYI